jgi:hypothetical protein
MVQSFEDLQFSVFVLLVLEHAFYCHDFECAFVSGFVHDTESACADFVFEDVSGGAFDWGFKFKEVFSE